jgi:hypothetical protein
MRHWFTSFLFICRLSRTNAGSHDDVVAELSTFGIGSNLLTVDPRSEESTMVIREWFANRRLKEATEKANKRVANSAGVVSAIGQYDVLFGKFHVLFQGTHCIFRAETFDFLF